MVKHKIVLIGGGHTHSLLLRKWDQRQDIDLTVVEPNARVPYTGMLPGVIAGHYSYEDCLINIEHLVQKAGAKFVRGRAIAIDPVKKVVRTETRSIPYDTLSIDIGIHSDVSSIPGANEHGLVVKPLQQFAKRWQKLASEELGTVKHIVVIGGGVTAVELALAMRHRLRKGKDLNITIIERTELVSGLSAKARKTLRLELSKSGISVLENRTVRKIHQKSVELEDQNLSVDLVVLATGAEPYVWLRECGIDTTNGYLDVDGTLRSTSHPDIFAVGDCAHFTQKPLPKAGVFAVRQVPILKKNILSLINGDELINFSPQSDYLKLITMGSKKAIAEKWGFSAASSILWHLKSRIDKRFVSRLDK